MNLASVRKWTNYPVEIRRALRLKEGDKVLFFQKINKLKRKSDFRFRRDDNSKKFTKNYLCCKR
jgi:bifunctional DNA-binding transcriptional regulator/antitoxin component of YhaV-PrlF toxin-antitoxin module